MEKLLQDQIVPKLLKTVDKEAAQKLKEERCRYCGRPLHCGNYPRKPRGHKDCDFRYSFNCSNPDCRKRHTPVSVRFLGRRVYSGVVVVLLSAMTCGLNERRVAKLRDELGVDKRTLQRWREWWLDNFVASAFWKAGRASFMPPLAELLLPLSMVDRFQAKQREGLVKLMQFLAPLSIGDQMGRQGM